MSKAAAKQNRVVELDINYSRHQMNRRRGGRDPSPEMSTRNQVDGGAGGSGGGLSRNRYATLWKQMASSFSGECQPST